MTADRTNYNRWSALSIFFVSIAVIALQLMLMRALSVSHYYHFSYLVISTALLGFGASGTFLALFFDLLKRNFFFWNLLFHLLFLIAVPVSYFTAQNLPLDTQYVLYSGEQLTLLIFYNVLMFIPFFFGGTIIGFMLSYFKKEVPELYGANLIGSGIGGIVALAIMFWVPVYQLPVTVTPIILLAMIFFFMSGYSQPAVNPKAGLLLLLFGAAGTSWAFIAEAPTTVDPYKSLSHFQQLERQNDAELILERYGPRGQIDVYSAPSFHHTLFAGPLATALPPSQLALLVDGEVAGAVFSIDHEEDAEIMDFTPQSLPYRLLDNAHVLLLGEISGINVWLAKRMGAESITVVQPNPQITELFKNELAELGGAAFSDERVNVITEDPRHYLQQSIREYDLIHLVAGEATSTGTGGLQGLNEDYLLTKESIARAREVLSDRGLISITRGIQSPPRDNIKIFSMFAGAISEFSDDDPDQHLLVSRNYLAATTILSNSPVSETLLNLFLDASRALQLDLEYYPGIVSVDIDQMNVIEGPDGVNYSYIHHAIQQILFGDADAFYEDWAYYVRAPTDDSPYFQNFFKWSSLDLFLETYGDDWFQRLELGYIILLITFLQLAVIAFLLIIAPLLFRLPTYLASPKKMPTFLYFFAIGTGFMFVEITFIQIFTKFLGDPIVSVSAIFTSILIFSGIGSSIQKKLGLIAIHRIRLAVTAIIITALFLILFSDPILNLFIDLGTGWRYLITVLMLMPVSFFLGWMFPSGMELLEQQSDSLIPWAWGINGFASVTAAPAAIMLSMSIGFSNVILLGLGCYIIAAATSWMWDNRVVQTGW
jgi:spermidine synthase